MHINLLKLHADFITVIIIHVKPNIRNSVKIFTLRPYFFFFSLSQHLKKVVLFFSLRENRDPQTKTYTHTHTKKQQHAKREERKVSDLLLSSIKRNGECCEERKKNVFLFSEKLLQYVHFEKRVQSREPYTNTHAPL